MADALTMLDGAIAATLRQAISDDQFDGRVRAAFHHALRATHLEQGHEPSRTATAIALEPSSLEDQVGVGSAIKTDDLERIRAALSYDKSEGRRSIWFHPGLVKPAVVGLAIWLDRLASPDNATALSATIRRVDPAKAAFGVELTDLACNHRSNNPEAVEAMERRVQAALVSAAWWALNSATAMRLGFVALAAEGERHLSNLPEADGTDPHMRHEMGMSPYVTFLKDN